jgi:hypothetical protein
MAQKYGPPVNRVDNVYDDRSFLYTLAPIESYKQAAVQGF